MPAAVAASTSCNSAAIHGERQLCIATIISFEVTTRASYSTAMGTSSSRRQWSAARACHEGLESGTGRAEPLIRVCWHRGQANALQMVRCDRDEEEEVEKGGGGERT